MFRSWQKPRFIFHKSPADDGRVVLRRADYKSQRPCTPPPPNPTCELLHQFPTSISWTSSNQQPPRKMSAPTAWKVCWFSMLILFDTWTLQLALLFNKYSFLQLIVLKLNMHTIFVHNFYLEINSTHLLASLCTSKVNVYSCFVVLPT